MRIFLAAITLFGCTPERKPETEEELIKQGYTVKEAKKEARSQRAEAREEIKLRNNTIRTATAVSRAITKGKK